MNFLPKLWRWRDSIMPGSPTVPATAVAYSALPEWRQASPDELERRAARFRIQQEVAAAAASSGWPGRCGLCDRDVYFRLSPSNHGTETNLREDLTCPSCGLTARNRAAMTLLLAHPLPESARIYMTEQASAAFVWLQAHFPDALGSEFGLDQATRMRLQNWFEHLGGHGPLVERDVTQLGFENGSLDAIGSYDVLEHVPDYPSALREFARCLRPGGRLVVTVPFLQDSETTVVRARLLAEGKVEHLMPPEMHGDPVAGGVLCFYHFGWDLLEACRAAGFREAHWNHTWLPNQGLFGLWTLVAVR